MAPVPPSPSPAELQFQQPYWALGHGPSTAEVVVEVVFGGLWSNLPHHHTVARLTEPRTSPKDGDVPPWGPVPRGEGAHPRVQPEPPELWLPPSFPSPPHFQPGLRCPLGSGGRRELLKHPTALG